MKILLIGATGKVGRRLQQSLPRVGETVAAGRELLDLGRPDSIRDAIRSIRPDVIVNAAGFTRVDAAESQPALVRAVNALAPGIIAEEAKSCGALLVHFSSVYVFDGTGRRAYAEDDNPRPVNAYGLSKLEGEQAIAAVGGAHLILRASWVYDTQGRDDFVLTMLRLAAQRDVLKVVDDQLGSPTWAKSLADATAQALLLVRQMKAAPGIYNLAALGGVSRFGLTAQLLERTRAIRTDRPTAKLQPIDTREFPLAAVRPLNSVLASEKIVAAGVPMTSWQEQLDGFVSELGLPPGSRG